MDYIDSCKHTERRAFASNIYSSWWKAWIEQGLPSLMPSPKWKKRAKNISVGDIVMIVYEGNLTIGLLRFSRFIPMRKAGSGLSQLGSGGGARRRRASSTRASHSPWSRWLCRSYACLSLLMRNLIKSEYMAIKFE